MFAHQPPAWFDAARRIADLGPVTVEPAPEGLTWVSNDLCSTAINQRRVQFARVPNPGQGYCLAYALATLLTGESSWSTPRPGHDRSVPAYDTTTRRVVWARPTPKITLADGSVITPPDHAHLADFGQNFDDQEAYVPHNGALTDDTLAMFFPGVDPTTVPLYLTGVGWIGVSPDAVIPPIEHGFIVRHSGVTPDAVTHFEAFLPFPQVTITTATGVISPRHYPPPLGANQLCLNYWSVTPPTTNTAARSAVTPAVTLFAQRHSLPLAGSPTAGQDTLLVLEAATFPASPENLVQLPGNTKAVLRIGDVCLAYRSLRFGTALQYIPEPVLSNLPDADLTNPDLVCYVAPLPARARRSPAPPASSNPVSAPSAKTPATTSPVPSTVAPVGTSAPLSPFTPAACPSEFDYLADRLQDHRVSPRVAPFPAPYSSTVAPCAVTDRCSAALKGSTLCLAHGRVCCLALPRAIPQRYATRACQSNWATTTVTGEASKGLTGHPNLRRLATLTHLQLLFHHRQSLLDAECIVLLGPRSENLALLSWLGVAAPIVCFRPIICASDTTTPLSSRGLNLTVFECAFDDSIAQNLPAKSVVIALDVAYYPTAKSAIAIAADSGHLTLVAGLEFYPGPGAQSTMQALGEATVTHTWDSTTAEGWIVMSSNSSGAPYTHPVFRDVSPRHPSSRQFYYHLGDGVVLAAGHITSVPCMDTTALQHPVLTALPAPYTFLRAYVIPRKFASWAMDGSREFWCPTDIVTELNAQLMLVGGNTKAARQAASLTLTSASSIHQTGANLLRTDPAAAPLYQAVATILVAARRAEALATESVFDPPKTTLLGAV